MTFLVVWFAASCFLFFCFICTMDMHNMNANISVFGLFCSQWNWSAYRHRERAKGSSLCVRMAKCVCDERVCVVWRRIAATTCVIITTKWCSNKKMSEKNWEASSKLVRIRCLNCARELFNSHTNIHWLPFAFSMICSIKSVDDGGRLCECNEPHRMQSATR